MNYLCADRYTAYASASGTPSADRYAGTAPLPVFFDATSIACSLVTYPFHQLQFLWNFGDSAGGATWSYGARTGVSKNEAFGAVAAHVFQTAGTKSVTLTVFLNGQIFKIYVLANIVVADPDTTFSGHNTICVSASTDFSGAPAGCLQVPNETDFDNPGGTKLEDSLNAGKRVLYCGGETFTASAQSTYTGTGPAQVGSYGTGNAIVDGSPGSSGYLAVALTGADLTVYGLEFDGDATTGQPFMTFGNTAWTNFLLLNCYLHGYWRYMNGVDWAASGGSGFYAVGNRFEAPDPTADGDMILVSNGSRIGILGNNFSGDGITTSQQLCRSNANNRFAISNNSFSGVGGASIGDKESLGIRSGVTRTSQYGVVYGNGISMGRGYTGIYPQQQPQDNTLDILDILIEANYVSGATSTGANASAISSNSQRITIRNNIGDGADADFVVGVSINQATAINNWVYNNTFWAKRMSGPFTGVSVDPSVGAGTEVYNTLVYTEGFTGTVVSDSGSKATKSNNTTDPTANPLFTSATPNTVAGFKVTAGSYALAAGLYSVPVYNDALAVQRSYGNKQPSLDMGAVQTTVN